MSKRTLRRNAARSSDHIENDRDSALAFWSRLEPETKEILLTEFVYKRPPRLRCVSHTITGPKGAGRYYDSPAQFHFTSDSSPSVGAVSDTTVSPSATVGAVPEPTNPPSDGSGTLPLLEARLAAVEADLQAVPALIQAAIRADYLEKLVQMSVSTRGTEGIKVS